MVLSLAMAMAIIVAAIMVSHPTRARRFISPAENYFNHSMPHYPGVMEFPMAQNIRVNQNTMQATYFTTRDPLTKVLTYYRGVWESEGYKVFRTAMDSNHVSLGVFDSASKIQKSITAIRRDGETYLFPSITRLASTGPINTETSSDDIPLFPGSTAFFRLNTIDAGLPSIIASSYNQGKIDKNLEFYRQEIKKLGFIEQEVRQSEKGEGTWVLRFKRGEDICSITLTPEEETGQIYVVYNLLEVSKKGSVSRSQGIGE